MLLPCLLLLWLPQAEAALAEAARNAGDFREAARL